MKCCIVGCPNVDGLSKSTSYHLFPHPHKERYRYTKWIEVCNNSRIAGKSSDQIYRQFRICRRHFDDNSFNGGCKRLLPNAIPTLHLNKRSVITPIVSSEMILRKQMEQEFTIRNEDAMTTVNELDTNIDLIEKYEAFEANQSDNTDEEDKNSVRSILEFGDGQQKSPASENCEELEYIEVLDDVLLNESILPDDLAKWKDDFYKKPSNTIAQNACTKSDPFEVSTSRKALEHNAHVFNVKIETEGKPITNQKESGRCWLFAILNCMRIPFCKQLNLDEFEFSQSYLFYWDKIERCHYFLNTIVKATQRGEEVDGRLISYLLTNPMNDGGQWDMIFNLIGKYGVMPKKCFPDSFSSESSRRMNQILKSKLREYAKVLYDLAVGNETSDGKLQKTIKQQMAEIYTIVGICLGIPDETFTWEYYDKNKAYHKIGPITPLEFYEKHVEPFFDIEKKICLINDPRPTSPYGELYTLDCLGNVVGGRGVLYNNQPIEILMDCVVKSIKKGSPVWFGCDVGKRSSAKLSALDFDVYDFESTFGIDIERPLSKADRLIYGESMMTHAMVFTAVLCDDNGKPQKFRVENSHGERGEKGYFVMSANWFKEYVYEIVVDSSLVADDILAVFDKTPIVLPAWDPMGTLAQ